MQHYDGVSPAPRVRLSEFDVEACVVDLDLVQCLHLVKPVQLQIVVIVLLVFRQGHDELALHHKHMLDYCGYHLTGWLMLARELLELVKVLRAPIMVVKQHTG